MALLTITDLCERFQISRPTVHRWVLSGALPQPLRVGALPRWRECDIAEIIDSKAAEARDGDRAPGQ